MFGAFFFAEPTFADVLVLITVIDDVGGPHARTGESGQSGGMFSDPSWGWGSWGW